MPTSACREKAAGSGQPGGALCAKTEGAPSLPPESSRVELEFRLQNIPNYFAWEIVLFLK